MKFLDGWDISLATVWFWCQSGSRYRSRNCYHC